MEFRLSWDYIFSLFHRNDKHDWEEKIKKAKKYKVNYTKGLNDTQVKERVDAGLTNKTRNAISTSYFEIFLKNIFTILNVILIALATVMIVFGLYQRLFFVVILIFNITISLVQDLKAKRLVSRLSLVSNPHATVIRNGDRVDIPFNEVVLSDIIMLQSGKTIPCDVEIVYGSVRVNESFLSGETDAVLKGVGKIAYAQSYVTSGTAYAKVVKVGNANYANTLQDKARSFSRPKSLILQSLTNIIRAISLVAIITGTAEIITFAANNGFAPENVVSSVDAITSSLVGMIPSGMYLMTSITLTVGVIILARNRMLVRELYSIEMLARVNIVCTDKTGTITDGNMEVKEVLPIGRITLKNLENIIGGILYITKDENLTAKALRSKYATIQIKGDCASIPFDSEKKFSAASYKGTTYVMGAYGFIDIVNDNATKHVVERLEKLGRRVLIVATGKGNIKNNKLPPKLTAVGVIGLVETIKSDAKANIEWFKQNDVDLRIVSGDSETSLRAIAVQVGLPSDKVISLENMSDEEVSNAALTYKIFARVSPEQKQIIIQSLRNHANTVAMIGDGVNDLLALKAADCSIAMANGADAAKSVAHLVSLDSNFSSLPKVVEEGRRVINNLQRVCSIFLVKTFFAMFFATLSLILSWFNLEARYPFSTNNLFLWEVLTIGIAPFFIALEPNRERITSGFISNIVIEALPAGIIQVFISLPILIAYYANPDLFPREGAIAICVVMFSVMSLVILLHVCMPINKYRRIVLIGTFIVAGIILAADVVVCFYSGGQNYLDADYRAINNACLLLGLLMFIVSIPLYFVLAKYFKVFINYLKRKNYEKGRTH